MAIKMYRPDNEYPYSFLEVAFNERTQVVPYI